MAGQIKAMRGGGLYRLGQMAGGVDLKNEGLRAKLEDAFRHAGGVVPGEDDDFRFGVVTANLAGEVKSIESGKAEIDDGNMGVSHGHEFKGFPAVGGFRANFAIELGSQSGGDTQANDFVIVRQ